MVDFYLGVPYQPKFDEDSFVPGLNIFGVIRTDSTMAYNNSFVEVQKVVPANDFEDSIFVDTIEIIVELFHSPFESESYGFYLTNSENIFSQTNYRPSGNFRPNAGDVLNIECYHPDLPVLTAQTIVPNHAQLIPGSLKETDKQIFFELASDSSIYMFDIYSYSSGITTGIVRLPTSKNQNTSIEIQNHFAIDSVVIYSYDYHLANYYLSSNTSLNFNKYKVSFSEVEGGYGVFGALNRAVLNLN